MKVKIFNHVWDLRFTKKPMEKYHGYCHLDSKQIRISAGINSKVELITIIHEVLHACDKFKDEEWVDQSSRDIASILWKLGWRKSNGPK